MSDKFRHSRFLTSKVDNSMRHSIGGELLSSQGIPYSHHTYPLPGERAASRRANSVHYDPAKSGGPISGGLGSTSYAPSMLGHMGFVPARELGREYLSNIRVDIGEVDEEELYDQVGSHISALAEAMETGDDKVTIKYCCEYEYTNNRIGW